MTDPINQHQPRQRADGNTMNATTKQNVMILRMTQFESRTNPLSDWTPLLKKYTANIRNLRGGYDVEYSAKEKTKMVNPPAAFSPSVTKTSINTIFTMPATDTSEESDPSMLLVPPFKRRKEEVPEQTTVEGKVVDENDDNELFSCRAKFTKQIKTTKEGTEIKEWTPYSDGTLRLFRNNNGECKMTQWDSVGKVRLNLFIAKGMSFQKGRVGTIYFMSMSDEKVGTESYALKVKAGNFEPLYEALVGMAE